MKILNYTWIIGVILVPMILIAPVVYFVPQGEAKIDNPWQYMPKRLPKTNHVDLLDGPFEDGPSVTKACVECHEEVTEQILHTAHWKWESDPVQVEGRSQPIALGKKNALNNFCIGIQSNWPPCTACHAGYGWVDETFDFSNPANIDCLVCHDNSGMYAKANGGYPADGVDLVSVAQSVGGTTRQNCGTCHFLGGGGNAVKHGDLDETLYHPSERIDVHMGKHDFVCTDCHQTEKHVIKGRSISVSLDDKNQIYCTDCHADSLHDDQRINNHMQKVACQSCHIPVVAIKNATKTHWDWSTAGQDIPEDVHEYLKIKGSFKYEKGLVPEYYWYSGTAAHYLLGDKIDPSKTILMNEPHGDINDPNAKIWPFKVHRAKQIYDVKNNYLLQPKTFGEGGFWTEFDWDKSAMLGSEVVDLDYSGQYDFIDTEMFWPITHMVASKDKVLQCVDCHGKNGNRMDWLALGYEGDPLHYGSR